MQTGSIFCPFPILSIKLRYNSKTRAYLRILITQKKNLKFPPNLSPFLAILGVVRPIRAKMCSTILFFVLIPKSSVLLAVYQKTVPYFMIWFIFKKLFFTTPESLPLIFKFKAMLGPVWQPSSSYGLRPLIPCSD